MKKLLILVGPSGSGKTTIGNYLKELGLTKLVTHTTRKIRPGEIDGVDYHFVSIEEFKNIEKVEFVEYAGNFYGLSIKEVQEKKDKYNCFCILEKQGAMYLKTLYPDAKIVFLYNSPKILKERIKKREKDEEVIKERINNIFKSKELENYKIADFIIKTDSTEYTQKNINKIINSGFKQKTINKIFHKIYLFFINIIY